MNASRCLRAPSVPLVVHDPFFSIWLPANEPAGSFQNHWTGTRMHWDGVVRVDGNPYVFFGRGVSVQAPKLTGCAISV